MHAEGILLLVVGDDQRIADTGKETDLVVDGPGIGLEGAGLPSLGFAKESSDQAVEHIDGLVGQAGGEVETYGDQRRVPTLPFVVSDVLHRASAELWGKLGDDGLSEAAYRGW
ncbi:hypothetical protein [Rhodovastum atsumiense]|uniref:Uncharacterized protein n=2 Tax=Rhodovastum atsumiense TaxID=504468 RepID=A0A5M6IIN0_9PROT|nr:hypothetical protein [Rhodovastum atsumiense]KAA5607767.1 hypothetical protein F1189_32035 [Rhodovastum atsumiense]